MSSDLPPINNPYQSSAPRMSPEAYLPPDRNKGIKTVAILFIVFGIMGLLTLPGLIIGTVVQLVVPGFQRSGPSMLTTPVVQEQPPAEDPATASDPVPPELQPNTSDQPSTPVRTPEEEFASQMKSRMQEFQRFNPFQFALGIINVILSGLLLWSGVRLIRFKLHGALLGRKICIACCTFELARILFSVWMCILVGRLFHGMETPNANMPVPLEIIMLGSMIAGVIFSVLYGTAKIVMYAMCYRYLGREHVQAQLS